MSKRRSPRKRRNALGAYLLCEGCDAKFETPSWCPLCRECFFEETAQVKKNGQ